MSPCTEISTDPAHETSGLRVECEGELIQEESTNVNEKIIIGQISKDTASHSAAEKSENVDICQKRSKDETIDHIEDAKVRESEETISVKNGNGLEIAAENVASEYLTGAHDISADVGIQSECAEKPTKIELPLTNGTDCQQMVEGDAMETCDLTDTHIEQRKSHQGNIVNDIQSEQIVKKASILENETASDCVSHGDQVNNDSRKRKLSSSPEDEPILKEGCSLQFKGFKKRILAQASLEVADEQMHHQQQTLPKPEELQPDLVDSFSTPLTEYAQYLGLQPIVKFKCYLCGETGFPSILSLQEHQCSCLKTSGTRPVLQQPAVPDMVTAEGECPTVGMAAATAADPADVSGTPSTNFRISRKVYLCSVCGTYYENWNLFLHMKEMHRRFICLFCLAMFTDAGMLATHLSGEHSVTDRLYDTQEGFRAEIADEACFLVCCDCERIFAHTDNFYEHVCPTPPSVEKHLQHQQPQDPKQLQKHRRQQQKQKQLEQSNQHIQGMCSLCGLRGAHFPTCRRASSNSNALTTLVDGSGAVTELSPLDGEHQSERQPVTKTDTIRKRSGKGKVTSKTLPSGDVEAEADGDEDYDISHAASFCQINIHETPADKPKASDQSSSLTPVPKMTLKTKNITTAVLSNNSVTKKNFVSVVKQESDTSGIHRKLEETPAVPESQRPKKTTESTTVANIKSGKRGASCSPVPTSEGKKPKFDQLKDQIKEPGEGTDEPRVQTSSPVPESDSSSSHSQDSDRLHINTQESESVDGQSCADEDDAAMKDAAKDPEATDAERTEENSSSEKQLTPATTKTEHPRHRISESDSESSGSPNDIPSHKSEDSSSSSDAEGVSSSEERKQDIPPEAETKQKSEDMSDDGGGTAEEPESGGEESSKDSPALVVDEEAADGKKDSGSGTSQPTTIAEGGEIQVAGDDVPALELTLEEQPEAMTLQALVKECVRVSCNSCVFCNHAKKIAVNGSQLALHLLAEHRFEPVVCTDTADLKPVPADGFTARLKEAVHNLHEAFFNTDSYDSTAEPSEASTAEQGDSSHVYDRSYECFHCHFVTTLHKELYVHNRKMHQKTILLCVMCKSNFYSYSELLCHICPGLYAPDADISFRCCLCSVDKLPSAFRLMVHLRKRHHACDVCLEATGDQQRLSNHVWKHKLHHLCYRCGIAYRNKPDITKHLFWKHGTESVLCKKCLQKKWPHVYHFCIPPTAFNCEECGTSFARAVALKVHRRLHSGDRPYTCEDCSDSFISRKLLARHRRLKHAPPEPLPPLPSSLENNAITHSEREFPATLDAEDSSIRDAETDKNQSSLENKTSVNLDKRTDNQMSGPGEKESDVAVKKNKVMDVYDLPPLNLSSDSDDSDEPNTKDSKTVTPPPAAVSTPEVKDSETEVKPEPPVSDNVVGEEEEPAPVQIIDGIWDNFKNYKASLERKEQEAAAVATGSYSTSHAIEVIMSDHDYCVVSKPSNLGSVDDIGSVDDASIGGLTSGEGPNVSDKTIEGDKDSGSNTDSSPETMEATDNGNRSKVVAADSGSAVPTNVGRLRVLAGTEKTLTQLSDTGRLPGGTTEATMSVASGTPPQPSNPSTTASSKKRTKQARKRQKREGASSSSSSSSSDSDSSSCSCGTNCSCSSSSSSSSGSSSSSSDSDSSTSEGRRRQAARRERRRERARKKAAAAAAAAAAATAATAAATVAATSGEATAEVSRTPTANSVPVAPCDTEREHADGVIHESDLDTDETETDEDFYDQHPQRQANRLLAEKRNRLMLLAAVAPASNGTAQLAQQLQELNQQQQQHQHQEQHQYQRQEEVQQQQQQHHHHHHHHQQQQQQDDQQQIQQVTSQQTLQQMQPQQHVRIGSGTVSGDSRKVRTRKRKRAVLADARTGSTSLAASSEMAVRPLGTLPSTTYRDSSGVVTQTPISDSTSVTSTTSAVRTTGGSGSEGENKRLSKRRRVPKRFYGDSSDEDGETPVTPQPKWRKTGSSGGGGGSSASVVSVGAPHTPSHVPEPPHLPIRQQVTLPSAAALLSSARSVAAGRRPVETMGHSTSSSSSSSSGSDDADSNYESASDGGGGGGGGGGGSGSAVGAGVGSVTVARTGGTAGAEVENSGNKSENLYCYCQCPYDEVSEMIACDGKDCQIEWFHFECVGIMVPPKGKWFCPDCRKKSSASRSGEYLLHA
ncbi:uncharacterized protein LOC126486380 [Schistocerca serialis cubense]|uniref:uncharacterized protein LOC126486380 n=1 Tax=Schistocerca serialis cubense TaxID=2023355 RepID=UPI00214ECE67|nr:uncharacterized protein LOC126486380 [Schistocerca serialis cubense]